jgi:hypothetical protein
MDPKRFLLYKVINDLVKTMCNLKNVAHKNNFTKEWFWAQDKKEIY